MKKEQISMLCVFFLVFSRYADFIVNEVDTDGNVVHLICLEPPPQVGLLLSVGFLCRVCTLNFLGMSLKGF
jgi:hypothetical protein